MSQNYFQLQVLILIIIIYIKSSASSMAQSRVQFFNSESSFGSQSILSSSRLDFAFDEIVNDTQQIFNTLRSFLIPREDLLDKAQLSHIMHRSLILLKQTIPNHQKYISKTNHSNKQIEACQRYKKQLQKLLNNYESYNSQNLTYQSFFKLYGVALQDFHKKLNSGITNLYQIQPDVVIIESNPQKMIKNSQKIANFESSRSSNHYQNRLIQELNEEINRLKRKQKDLLIQHQQQLEYLKRQTQLRVNSLLKIYETKNQSQIVIGIKKQLYLCSDQLVKQTNKQKQSSRKIVELLKQIQNLTNQNKVLRQQLESNRRMKSSRVSEMEDDNKSIHSQLDGIHSTQLKKYKKKVKNLEYQINLLRGQLNNEREIHQKEKKQRHLDENKQITRLRSIIQMKNKQLQNKKIQLDKQKVQGIKLNDKLENSLKEMELAKFLAVKTPLTPVSFGNSITNNGFSRAIPDYNRLQDFKGSRYTLSTYIGDGNEFYPYFELLNKQFKIRFKRACLKDKELLYKANGLEIGVISIFQIPNQIRINLHLSNFCDQKQIKNVRIKVTNAKSNKMQIDRNQIQILGIGQQIKCVVTINIRNYPIGCTALICQYEYYGKNEEVRILLPIHIFKMLQIKPRDDEFRADASIQLIPQRKIVKDISTLFSYFKGSKLDNKKLSSTIFHQHTQTKLLCDIEIEKGNLIIKYEHRSGEQALTEYIVKSLSFLLRKDDNI